MSSTDRGPRPGQDASAAHAPSTASTSSVAPGEVHGFLGPNGAGKSTTIRVLLGLLRSNGGTASVFGLDPWRDATEIHRRLAYVPGDVSVWPNLSGGETIDLLLRMRGLDPRATRARRPAGAVRAGPHQEGARLLQGQPAEGRARRRVRRARPTCSILDEPTSGLDPLMEQVFNECLAEHKAAGHDRPALQPHPQRGRAAGRPGDDHPQRADGRDRHARTSCATCAATASGPRSPVPVPDLAGLDGVHDVAGRRTGRLRVGRPRRTARPLLSALDRAGVVSLTSTPPTLEELFLDAYRSYAVTRPAARHRPARAVRAAP